MKTERTNKTFSNYLKDLEESHKDTIIQLNALLCETFGEENRYIWEGIFWGGSRQTILGFGEYDTKRKDGATWFMVGIAIQKNYYSLYINAVKDNQYLVRKYADTLGKVKIGSSSVSFTKLENLNLDAIKKLIAIAYKQWVGR